MKTLSIVIPIYNEKSTLSKTLKRVEESPVGELKKEIILVDDFSTDGSREILEDLVKTGRYKIFFQDKNSGKGSCLRLGFKEARGDFIIVQDADLEYNPNEYQNLLEPLTNGLADVVYGSRFVGDKQHRVLFFWHYLGNRFLTLFSNIFTGLNLSDMETCYKAFTKQALLKVLPSLKSNRFGIEPEITAVIAHNKLRIFEVGISYAGRTYEEGKKINWKDGLSAIWTIVKSSFRLSSIGRDRYKTWLLIILLLLPIFSITVLKPEIEGDSISYVETLGVLKGGITPTHFVPNRLITTYFGLLTIRFADAIFHNLKFSWLLVNSLLYVIMGLFFYSLLQKLFQNKRISFISTLFLVTNYSAVTFGLAYLMDIGGWTFYIISLYFSSLYLETKKTDWLWLSALVLSFGGLFKEYALLGYIVLFGLILFINWKEWRKIAKLTFFTGLITFGPVILINLYSLFVYDYTYFSWLAVQSKYVYKSRILEYIKSFGSLYNFDWFIFLPGFYLLLKNYKKIFKNESLLFILLVCLSSLPIFLWGAITQRVLFITVPALVLISSLFLKKIDTYWYVVLSLLFLYVLSSFLMDSYILNTVNLGF